MPAQIILRDVTLGYDRHPAVHHLSGEVASGALLAVVGPNGAGKSTLFRGLAGILKPLSGTIDLGGLDIRDIAYLPQSADIDRSFPISVFDFVGTGLWRRIGFFGGMGRHERDRIAQALAAVGLTGFENRNIGTLSGGQMQRMLFARVLLQDARLIVLDEPFNAIDARTSADLMLLVQRWHDEKRTRTVMVPGVEMHPPERSVTVIKPVPEMRKRQVMVAARVPGPACDPCTGLMTWFCQVVPQVREAWRRSCPRSARSSARGRWPSAADGDAASAWRVNATGCGDPAACRANQPAG